MAQYGAAWLSMGRRGSDGAAWLSMGRRGSVMGRRGSDGAAWLSMGRRGSVWGGVAQLWGGVAQLWGGVAQLATRRLAGRQARVRFSARPHREVFPTEHKSDEDMERLQRMATDECIVIE